jgi:hypothetical protein
MGDEVMTTDALHISALRASVRIRRLACLSFALAALLEAAPAAASDAPSTTSFGWVRLAGAQTCIGTAALAAAVERRLGRPALASPATAQRSIEGSIAPAQDRLGSLDAVASRRLPSREWQSS